MFNTVSFLFLDTESKTSREFEHIHIKELMKQFDAKTTADLKIEVELRTILDPCPVCSGQMNVFQAKYNAKINIYTSGAENAHILENLYPKLKKTLN